MPSRRHTENIRSLFFLHYLFFPIFYFFVMQNFLLCAPTVFINACVGSIFFTI